MLKGRECVCDMMTPQPVLHRYHLADGVVAFSTTRHGGYSTGNYASFNINMYCGDAEEAVQRNRQLLCQQLGISDDRLIMPHQVHQTHIAKIDQRLLVLPASDRQQALDGVDAVMTDIRGVCIGVSTADCIPVVIYDSVHRVVCAIHAGWRGTVARIVEKSVQAMMTAYGSCPTDMTATIGPGISLDSFEVGDEVFEAFLQAGFDMAAISRREQKWHIDLPECNHLQLLSAGVRPQAVTMSGICTFKQTDDFFSARRMGINSGRIFTGVMML